MSKTAKKTAVPRLRFPEFKNGPNWEKLALSELGETISGLTYSPDDVREEGLLVLRSSNIKDNRIVFDDCVYVDPKIKGANPTEPDDILICVRNGSKSLIGKNALIPSGLPLCMHGAFMSVFRTPNAKFVFQLFQTDSYEKQVSNDLGATINSINSKNLLRYEFFVPKTKNEQDKIVACLSTLDDRITAQTAYVAALKQYKKGLLQQLFPQDGETVPRLRFPEFRSDGEWKAGTLGGVADFASGGTPSKDSPKYWGGTIPWISASSMYEFKVRRSELNVTKAAIGNGTRLADPKSILILVRGSMLFNRVPICILEVEAAFNQDVKALTIKNDTKPYFLAYHLLSYEQRIPVDKTGIGAGKIDTDDLKKLVLYFPATTLEQEKIAELLSLIDDQTDVQMEKLVELKRHKKGLLQQLFPSVPECADE